MTKTVFITGADKGLGRSLTKVFLEQGFHTFAGQFDPETGLPALEERFPDTLELIPLDVTDLSSVERAAVLVAEKTSALDILINNAGVFPGGSRVPLEELELSERRFFHTMDVNAFGPLRVTQQFLPLLREGEMKRIVNVSSEAGSIADCWRNQEYAYCMSKAALNMQSKILQNYLGPDGFKVLAVHPGWMRTDMGGAEADIHPDEAADGILDLAMRDWGVDDPIYFDYQGKQMRW